MPTSNRPGCGSTAARRSSPGLPSSGSGRLSCAFSLAFMASPVSSMLRSSPGEPDDIQEMSGGVVIALPASTARRKARQGTLERGTETLDLRLGDDQRRQGVAPHCRRRRRSSSFWSRNAATRSARHHRLHADQQAFAAHFRQARRIAIDDRGQLLFEQTATSSAHVRRSPGLSMTSSTALAAATASGLPPKVEPCDPGVMPAAASAVARQAPDRKAAAERFRQRHHVRRHAGALIGKQLAGAAHAGLHFVENQKHALFVAKGAQRFLRQAGEASRTPPSPWTGSIRMAAVSGPSVLQAPPRRRAAPGRSRPSGAQAFEIFGRAGRVQGRQRAAVERALEGDDAKALGMSLGGVVACA